LITALDKLNKDRREKIRMKEQLKNVEKESHSSNKKSMNRKKVHLEEAKIIEEVL